MSNQNDTVVNVFDRLDYDIALAYDYNGEGGDDIIDADGGQPIGFINQLSLRQPK